MTVALRLFVQCNMIMQKLDFKEKNLNDCLHLKPFLFNRFSVFNNTLPAFHQLAPINPKVH